MRNFITIVVLTIFSYSNIVAQNTHAVPDASNHYNKDGKRIGEWIELLDSNYNEISDIEKAVFYRKVYYNNNGFPEGNTLTYWITGELNIKMTYNGNSENSDGESISYYKSGKISCISNFMNNLLHGERKCFYENDAIFSKCMYENGKTKGKQEYFYDNGIKQREGFAENGLANGYWIYYFDNGNKQSEGQLVNEKKHGVWKEYFKSGRLNLITFYENGIENGNSVVYYENGNKQLELTVRNGLIEGIVKYYNEDGSFAFEREYFRGVVVDFNTLLSSWNDAIFKNKDFNMALDLALSLHDLIIQNPSLKTDTNLIYSYFRIGKSYYRLFKFDSSSTYYLKGIDIYNSISNSLNKQKKMGWIKEINYHLNFLATSYRDLGRYEQADKYYTIILNYYKENIKEFRSFYYEVLYNIAETKFLEKKYKEALNYYLMCSDSLVVILKENCKICDDAKKKIAYIYSVLNDYENAEKYFQKALKVMRFDREGLINRITLLDVYTNHLKKTKEYNKALKYRIDIQNIIDTNFKRSNAGYMKATDSIAALYRIMGLDEKSDSVYRYNIITLEFIDSLDKDAYSILIGKAIKIYWERGIPEQALYFHLYKYTADNYPKDSLYKKSSTYLLSNLYSTIQNNSKESNEELIQEEFISWKEAYDTTIKLFNSNQFVKALDISKQLYNLTNKQLSTQDSNYINSYLLIASINLKMANYEESGKYLLKIQKVITERSGIYNLDFIRTMILTGKLYVAYGKYIEAGWIFKGILTILNDNGFNETKEYFLTKLLLAKLYTQMGYYEKSEDLTYEVINTIKDNHLNYLSIKKEAYYNLGLIGLIEEVQLLVDFINFGKEINTEVENNEYSFIDETLFLEDIEMISLLKTPNSETDFIEIFNFNSRVEELIIQSFGENHPALGILKSNIALYYSIINRLTDAEMNIELAIKILEVKLPLYHPSISQLLLIQGYLNEQLGKYTEAIDKYMNIVNIQDNYGFNFHILANAYLFLSNISSKLKLYNNSNILAKLALKLLDNNRLQKNSTYCNVLNTLGLVNVELGNFNIGKEYLLKSLKLHNNIYGENSIYCMQPLNNIGVLNLAIKDFKEASDYFLRSLNIFRNTYKDTLNQLYNQILGNLLVSELFQMRIESARNYIRQYLINQKFIFQKNFKYLSEKEKGDYYYAMGKGLKSVFELCLSFPTDIKLTSEILNHRYYSKGLMFYSTKNIYESIQNSKDTNLIQLFNEWITLKNIVIKNENSQDLNSGPKIQLDSIKKQMNQLEKKLSFESEVLSKEINQKDISWKDIREKLNDDEAAIEIIRFNKIDYNDLNSAVEAMNKDIFKESITGYAVFIVKKSSVKPELVFINNGDELETTYLERYTLLFNRQSNGIFIKDATQSFLSELYNYLWKPIQEKLPGIKKVFVSTDGIYNDINLNTLIIPGTDKYLLEDIDIVLVSNTKDILDSKDNKKLQGNRSIYLLGDPLFKLDSINNLQIDSQNKTDSLTDSSFYNRSIAQIPNTRKEIEIVKNLFVQKNWEIKCYLGKDANEEAVRAANSPQILHLATHGRFMSEREVEYLEKNETNKKYSNNPLFRSYLLLAGAETTINSLNRYDLNREDGILNASEAMNLNLSNTDLVVLSACETGLGESVIGEGVYGLQRAFLTAGAKLVIMSLKKVPDKETKELMIAFYSKFLEGKPYRIAFKEAQLEMIKKYFYPYYWGAFVIIGI